MMFLRDGKDFVADQGQNAVHLRSSAIPARPTASSTTAAVQSSEWPGRGKPQRERIHSQHRFIGG
jgi:hypothetical protein